MTVLVTGGRGHVGRSVAKRLLAAGEKVRIGSSDPANTSFDGAAEVVEVDLARPQTLAAALDGVSKVFLYAKPETAGAQVEILEDAGIEHVTFLSTRSLTFLDADTNPIAQLHVQVERALGQSSLPWTFLRAGTFSTNTLQWAESIRTAGVVRAPYPEAYAAPIHEDDIADVATLTLTEDGHAGVAYAMSGPTPVTQREQVALIGEAIGRPVRFEELQPEQYRETLSRWGRSQVVDQLLRYLETWNKRPVPVIDQRRQLIGSPGRPYRQWALDHADDFR
ncbi:NAD(P)H-binding protein [Streptomyces sp. NPDC046831]|uniref:SDR family oxidoreductase n=1 Tax=Streptomyces sp. NPDC046831 TaxID=3154805 RepID=UPI0033D087F9